MLRHDVSTRSYDHVSASAARRLTSWNWRSSELRSADETSFCQRTWTFGAVSLVSV